MITDKTEISYWLSQSGENNPLDLILTTNTSKVPEIGEVIHFRTLYDKEWAEVTFKEDYKKKLLPLDETCLLGHFLVVGSKRFIKRDIFEGNLETQFSNGKGVMYDTPVECIIETFEITIEPFRETELTETPIAKLRNALNPIFGVVEMLKMTQQFPEKEKEILDLFRSTLQNDIESSLEKARELLKNNNWK